MKNFLVLLAFIFSLSLFSQGTQLERGVQEALKLLETQEFELKLEPKAPMRWKRPKGYENEN